MQKFLEHDSFIQLLQYPLFFLEGERLNKFFLHFGCEPVDLFLITNIFEFDTDMMGITFLEMRQNIPETGGSQSDQISCEKRLIHILFGKSEKAQIQVGPPVFPWSMGFVLASRWPLFR